MTPSTTQHTHTQTYTYTPLRVETLFPHLLRVRVCLSDCIQNGSSGLLQKGQTLRTLGSKAWQNLISREKEERNEHL